MLRNFLQAGGQAEYPDSGLAAAAVAEVRRATSGVLLRALAPADHANAGATEEFLAAARSRSDRSLPQAVRHVVRERHSGARH